MFRFDPRRCAAGMSWATLVLAAGAALLLILSDPLAAQTAQEIKKAAADAIRQLDLQTEFMPPPRLWRITVPREFVWLAIALAIAVLLYSFSDMIPIWRFGRSGEWADAAAEAGEVGPKTPAAVMVAADELARQGRFVEAMHVLLLQSLADIRRHLDEEFADSLTSREILRSTRLSQQGRASLKEIVGRVEWTYFGEHPAVLMDYVACRQSFNDLAQALHGSAKS